MFGERYRLVGYYENVQGLIPNAPVWLAGTRVGRVESVNLGTRPDGEPAVKVVLVVDEDVQERIRADSSASIGTIGLLGDRYVEISLGSPNEPILEDGAEIRIANPAEYRARDRHRHAGARQHRDAREEPERRGRRDSRASRPTRAWRARSRRWATSSPRSSTARGCCTA